MVTETIPPNATLPQLRTVMERCVDQAEELVKTAEAATGGKGRCFTDDEQKDFDELRDTITQCRQRIEAKDFLAEQTKSRGRKTPVEPIKDGGGDPSLRRATRGGITEGVGRHGWSDRTGMEVRCLEKGERLADVTAEKHSFDARSRGLRLGNIVRSMITGDTSFAREELRALGGNVNTAGGYLVPDLLSSEVIDLARANSVCFKAGARIIPHDGGTLTMARLTADPAPSTKSENSAFSETEATFDAILFVPKTIGILSKGSRELFADAPNAAEIIELSIAQSIAHKLDELALVGTGTSTHLGVMGIAGFNPNPVTTVGSPSSYAKWLTAWGEVSTDNAMEPFSIVCHPRDAESLYGLTEATTNGYLQPPIPLREPRAQWLRTSVLSITEGAGSNESSSYLGDFRQMIFAMRQDITIEISNEAGEAFARNQTHIRGLVRWDVGFSHIDHFSRLSGILA